MKLLALIAALSFTAPALADGNALALWLWEQEQAAQPVALPPHGGGAGEGWLPNHIADPGKMVVPPAASPRSNPPADTHQPAALTEADLDAGQRPTPMEEIGAALRAVNPRGKVFIDIGCGFDCRAGIVAVRDFGAARVVALEIDPVIADSARRYVEHAGLSSKIKVSTADAATVEFPKGAVGFVYLFEDELARLAPKLKQLERFASYAHEVPGMQGRRQSGSHVYEKQRVVMKAFTYRPSYGVWNGRKAQPKNGCHCGMCQSLRSQTQPRTVYRPVVVNAAPPAGKAPSVVPTQRAGHWETRKVCQGGVCRMVKVFVP